MHLSVPVASAPDRGRKRPDTIGGSADVEPAQKMYPYLTPPMRKPQGESLGLTYRLGYV